MQNFGFPDALKDELFKKGGQLFLGALLCLILIEVGDTWWKGSYDPDFVDSGIPDFVVWGMVVFGGIGGWVGSNQGYLYCRDRFLNSYAGDQMDDVINNYIWEKQWSGAILRSKGEEKEWSINQLNKLKQQKEMEWKVVQEWRKSHPDLVALR